MASTKNMQFLHKNDSFLSINFTNEVQFVVKDLVIYFFLLINRLTNSLKTNVSEEI